jgi:hypothetical protein
MNLITIVLLPMKITEEQGNEKLPANRDQLLPVAIGLGTARSSTSQSPSVTSIPQFHYMQMKIFNPN